MKMKTGGENNAVQTSMSSTQTKTTSTTTNLTNSTSKTEILIMDGSTNTAVKKPKSHVIPEKASSEYNL
jgi:hypothetical protein